MLLYASIWIFNFFLTCLECSYGALLAKCRFSTEKQSKFQWAESHGSAILLVHLSCSRVSTENHMAYPSRLTHPDSFKWLQGKWHESWDQSCGHSTSCHRPIVWTNDLQHVMHVSAMSDKSTSTAIWASGPVAPLWVWPSSLGPGANHDQVSQPSQSVSKGQDLGRKKRLRTSLIISYYYVCVYIYIIIIYTHIMFKL